MNILRTASLGHKVEQSYDIKSEWVFFCPLYSYTSQIV